MYIWYVNLFSGVWPSLFDDLWFLCVNIPKVIFFYWKCLAFYSFIKIMFWCGGGKYILDTFLSVLRFYSLFILWFFYFKSIHHFSNLYTIENLYVIVIWSVDFTCCVNIICTVLYTCIERMCSNQTFYILLSKHINFLYILTYFIVPFLFTVLLKWAESWKLHSYASISASVKEGDMFVNVGVN